MGVPRNEIKNFADPYYWLKYYPPICMVSVQPESWMLSDLQRRESELCAAIVVADIKPLY